MSRWWITTVEVTSRVVRLVLADASESAAAMAEAEARDEDPGAVEVRCVDVRDDAGAVPAMTETKH